MLDDGIDLVRSLWEGQGSYDGKHYHYESGRMDLAAAARPVQNRIPLWVVGVWPSQRSMCRALRCDGVIPQYRLSGGTPAPDDASAVRTWLTGNGRGPDFDVIADGETLADDRAAAQLEVAGWQQAGCTWWLETRWGVQEDLTDRIGAMRERLKAGPPRSPRPNNQSHR
jgi:hypothetical protein